MASAKPKAPSAGAKALEVDFELERETKNAYRYRELDVEEGERASVGNIYLTKAIAATIGNPQKITVQIQATDG